MTFDLTAVDAALIDALPILSVTAFPVLAITAGVAAWLMGQEPDDDFNVDDYRQPVAVGRATVRQSGPVDAHTQVIPRVLTDGGTPVYDQLAARRTAHQILAELGQRARTGVTA